jgi:hypothetical protein
VNPRGKRAPKKIPVRTKAQTIAYVQKRLEGLVKMARDKTMADPNRMRGMMSESQIDLQRQDPWFFRIHIGRLIEDAVAMYIELDPELNDLVLHTGASNKAYDFIGKPGTIIAGQKFEITTDHPVTLAEHQDRDPKAKVITYERLPSAVHPNWHPDDPVDPDAM